MVLEFKDERDKDFLEAYERMLKEFGRDAPYVCRRSIIREALKRKAKRFYVSYEQCYRNISRMVAGKEVVIRSFWKRIMYEDILEAVKKKMSEGMRLDDAVMNVVYSPAPRFYIDEDTAVLLLYRLVKQKSS